MTKRPNILFLMSDQQRWDALGCVNPLVKTPHLDALASRGIRFTQAVCNVPMCVPSRYSMMLGLYPSQCGIRHNTQMCPTDDDLPAPVIPQRLASLGYQTAGFGKTHWYLGSTIAPGIDVKTSRRGFQVKAQARPADPGIVQPGAVVMQNVAPELWARLQEETRPFGEGGESILGYLGCTSTIPAEEHLEGWLTRQALNFLEGYRSDAGQLFLYLSFDFPHPGLNVPKEYEDLYDLVRIPERPLPPWKSYPQEHVEEDWRAKEWARRTSVERRRTTLRYYALCSFVDDMFGKIMRKLEEIDELDNTFILFCSDHGEMLGDRRHRFSKYCLYEGSARIPLIIAGAGVPPEKQGTIDHRPTELVDIVPTLLEVAGASAEQTLPGISLLGASGRKGSFCEFHGSGYERLQSAPAYMWRSKEWKLILYLAGKAADAAFRVDQVKGELYDLGKDPQEWGNLYDMPDYAGIREELTRQLLMHLASVWAKYPRKPSRGYIEHETVNEATTASSKDLFF